MAYQIKLAALGVNVTFDALIISGVVAMRILQIFFALTLV